MSELMGAMYRRTSACSRLCPPLSFGSSAHTASRSSSVMVGWCISNAPSTSVSVMVTGMDSADSTLNPPASMALTTARLYSSTYFFPPASTHILVNAVASVAVAMASSAISSSVAMRSSSLAILSPLL